MTVAFNALAALKRKTGVGQYVAQLAAALPAELPTGALRLYPGETLSAWVGRLQSRTRPGGGGPARAGRLAPLKPLARKLLAHHFRLWARGARLYHEPNFLPFATRLPTVVTVHDLSVMRHPEWHPADRVAAHRAEFPAALRRADAVVAVSAAVRSELLGEFGVDAAKVFAVVNGLDPAMTPQSPETLARVRAAYDLPERYFLAVGTVEPRKNLGVALRAFARLPEALRRDCPLILAGPWGWRSEPERALFDAEARPAGARHLGYVPGPDLPALYELAHCLVYPSHYEGFGLPLLEMLAFGGHVLSSGAEAVRETAGPYATALAATDLDAWVAAMATVAASGRPADASQRVEYARGFSWARSARQTAAVYRGLVRLEDAEHAHEVE